MILGLFHIIAKWYNKKEKILLNILTYFLFCLNCSLYYHFLKLLHSKNILNNRKKHYFNDTTKQKNPLNLPQIYHNKK